MVAQDGWTFVAGVKEENHLEVSADKRKVTRHHIHPRDELFRPERFGLEELASELVLGAGWLATREFQTKGPDKKVPRAGSGRS